MDTDKLIENIVMGMVAGFAFYMIQEMLKDQKVSLADRKKMIELAEEARNYHKLSDKEKKELREKMRKIIPK